MRRINLGVLTVYADEPDEAEVAILVHPNYRRLGYAKELFHVFRETMKEYHLNFTVMSERAFLAKQPDMLANLDMTLEDDFEYWLSRQRKAYLLEKRDDLLVTKASREHFEAIADFQAKLSMNLMMLPYVTPKRLWLMKLENFIS